jgi:hypothetical protein
MGIPESAAVPGDSAVERPASAGSGGRESADHRRRFEVNLRRRIEKWVDAIGYWGEASQVLVGETIATDYSPPRTTATFRVGALSFHCVENEETGDFRVRLKGSKIHDIPDLATLHRAIQESEQSSRTGPGK